MPTATEEAPQQLAESLRSQLTAVAPTHADTVIASLVQAMQATKTAIGLCRTCGTRVSVDIPDANAAVRAIEVLMTQTEGRPGTADADEGQTLMIERGIAGHLNAADLLAQLAAGHLDALRETLTEAANAEREEPIAGARARDLAGVAAPA